MLVTGTITALGLSLNGSFFDPQFRVSGSIGLLGFIADRKSAAKAEVPFFAPDLNCLMVFFRLRNLSHFISRCPAAKRFPRGLQRVTLSQPLLAHA